MTENELTNNSSNSRQKVQPLTSGLAQGGRNRGGKLIAKIPPAPSRFLVVRQLRKRCRKSIAS